MTTERLYIVTMRLPRGDAWTTKIMAKDEVEAMGIAQDEFRKCSFEIELDPTWQSADPSP